MTEDLLAMVKYMTDEQWDYTLEGGEIATLQFGILNGRLFLSSDGTWSFEED